MAKESRGLGRGLQALLSAQPARSVVLAETTAAGARGVSSLPVNSIQTGSSQPRRTIAREPLEELTSSIRANGVIQPIVVRPVPRAAEGAPQYEIVAGERRWQAAKLAGLADIPAVIRDLSDQEALAVALIENIQREQLTPAEEARSLQRLAHEFGLTHQQVATAVGRSRAAVSNLIRLLDLPAAVVDLIDSKALSMGHARALLGLTDDADRARVGTIVAERGLSVRETEALVRKALHSEERGTAPRARTEPAVLTVSEVLKTRFVRVRLEQGASEKGRLIVEFGDPVTRDALLSAIREAAQDE